MSTIEKHKEGYVKIRVIESLQELSLALKFLKEDLSKNSASKAFMSWKALLSALVVINLEKMPRYEKERKWYYRTGFLAPATSLKRISQRLDELGYKVIYPTAIALQLRRYALNGLYKEASDYANRNEAMKDVIHLSKEIFNLVKTLFKEYWDNEIEEHYRLARKELPNLQGTGPC